MTNDARETAAMNLHMYDEGSAYGEQWAERVIDSRMSQRAMSLLHRSLLMPKFSQRSGMHWTKAATDWLHDEGEVGPKNPTVGSLPGCCARAPSGHVAAAAPPMSVMN
jgi:hypothetical protein